MVKNAITEIIDGVEDGEGYPTKPVHTHAVMQTEGKNIKTPKIRSKIKTRGVSGIKGFFALKHCKQKLHA